MKRVYIAGPYDGENVIEVLGNIRRGIRAGVELMKAGYAIYCPFLDFLFGLVSEEDIPKRVYQDNSLEWIVGCYCIYLLPGWEKSRGVKRELKIAEEWKIPKFTTLEALMSWEL